MVWQRLRGGDNSKNVQAQIANFGIGYKDARDIALDVFNDNFARLSESAHRRAVERVEEFTLNYLNQLYERQPTSVENIGDPGVQSSILEAQSSFAVSGDETLGQVLVDLLTDRTAVTERNIKQLSLHEAIYVSKKLTAEHFKALSLLFLVTRTRSSEPLNPGNLYAWLCNSISPFSDSLRVSDSDVSHLAATGCLWIGITSLSIPEYLLRAYPGLYAPGFNRDDCPEDLIAEIESAPSVRPRFTTHLRDPELVQVNAIDEAGFVELTENLSEGAIAFLRTRFGAVKRPDEVAEELGAFDRRLGVAVDKWQSSSLSQATLSAVGIAIGHANVRRTLGEEFDVDLGAWIN